LPEFVGEFQITGRVTDTAGRPLANCRVNSGAQNKTKNGRGY
jgi:hypothetical protein